MADVARTRTPPAVASETQMLEAVGAVMQSLGRSSFDLRDVLETVIAEAVRLSRAEYGDIYRLDPATGSYVDVAYDGTMPTEVWEIVRSTPLRPGRETLVGRTVLERAPVHIIDVLADPEYLFPAAVPPGVPHRAGRPRDAR